jgi:hypothetical protein
MACNDLETFERPFSLAMTTLPMQDSHHVIYHSPLTPLASGGPRAKISSSTGCR